MLCFLSAKFRSDPNQKFGLRWFIPEFLRQRKIFRDVIVAALLLHLFALAVPLFFQLVIDKVLTHEGFSTLIVLTIGISVALVFDAVFSFLRRYLLLFATNKIDIRVATRTFSKLLRLPIDFFENASSGVLVKHMQQSEKIRQFLSGKLFLTVLDATSLFVFIPVLFFYSARLTFVVLFFTFLIGCVIALMIKPFQRRLAELYEAEGQRQALLVETIHGMQTVKSLALEPRQRQDWDSKAAQAVNMNFKVGKISTIAQSVTGFLEKIMLIAVIAIGALGVFDGTVTVGALVAFQMISNRVSGPLVQLVTLVHEYQETALSVKMLGEIMNRPTERDGNARGIRPEFKGRIDFESIAFRYGPDSPPALTNMSFSIPEGTIFGLVGRSGSGKTTVTRLLQGLYPVQEGVIRFDGYDIREIDLVHLRTNIGVVLQDNFLFQGSVRDNIAAAKPDATFEQVIEAARMAGADEFIERLPRGFDTPLTENASNLSGGQKQRLAIARALLTQPRILILDEATSALDPESESIIQKNLKIIAKGRTVIIVSHRLSSLTDADAILVLKQGEMEDLGTHHELVQRCETYKNLWVQQTRHMS
jgi:ATP-binding cassette, subfamily B, bacterial HlyB/CyaB